MWRSISAVAVGFVLWSVLWLIYNLGLKALQVLPSQDTQPITAADALAVLLAGSVVFSFVAGWVTAAIVRSGAPAPILALGSLLLAVGILVQWQYRHLMPLWYHVLFLGLLIPFCLVGARRAARRRLAPAGR
jgi:hypothetical protein